MRILIADDDPFSRRFLQKTLEKWGYETIAVDNGQMALEHLQSEDAPYLAIVDWMMPGIDGLEVCRRIRKNEIRRPIYIIMLTAKGELEDLVQAMEAGADDFATKSFDVRELQVRLRAGERIVKLEETLRRMASRDELTGMWNRSAILDMLDRELAHSRRDGRSVGVIMADIDYFKMVNDFHGHAGGDAVLVAVAKRLQSELRKYDFVGRYGGEEFLAVLPGASAAQTAQIAERLRAAVASEPFAFGTELINVTASFGTAISGEDGQHLSADSVIRAADVALYQAKHAGRNCVEVAKSVTQAILDAQNHDKNIANTISAMLAIAADRKVPQINA